MLYSISKFKGRPTKDIDFLAQNIDNDSLVIKDIFAEICNEEFDDGIVFDADTISTQTINEQGIYSGVRLSVVAYMGQAKILLKVDIGFGDIVIPKPIALEYPALLELPSPTILAYSYYSVIAEKFEAIISLSLANSRMKDFYDIYYLTENMWFDGRVLQEAVAETFSHRGTILEKNQVVFSMEFAEDSKRTRQWSSFMKRMGLESISFAKVMQRLKNFLQPIYNSIIYEEEHLMAWSSDRSVWQAYKQ